MLDVIGSGLARRAAVRVPTPRWMNATTSQGVSRPQEELDVLPFEPVTISSGTTGFLLARPQRPFRGERLVMSAVLNNGDDAALNVVIDPAIFVGAVQVGAAQGSIPISMFSATAFGVRLSWPAAGQGTDCKIFIRLLTALLPETSITVAAAVVGRAMR